MGLCANDLLSLAQSGDKHDAAKVLKGFGGAGVLEVVVIEIRKAMKSRGLTQQEAAKRMGITQPKVSDMMRGDFANLSESKLMDCLARQSSKPMR